MQDKYKIQPLEGHPVWDWTKQYEGSGATYYLSRSNSLPLDVYNALPAYDFLKDRKRFEMIIANPVHIHTEHYALMHPEVINPFSSLGKR